MAVEKRPEEKTMDVNRDGKVNSLDARKILRSLVGLEVMGDRMKKMILSLLY